MAKKVKFFHWVICCFPQFPFGLVELNQDQICGLVEINEDHRGENEQPKKEVDYSWKKKFDYSLLDENVRKTTANNDFQVYYNIIYLHNKSII